MVQKARTINPEYRHSVLTWLHLVRIFGRISRDEQDLLHAHGLTAAQFDVLSHLASEPGLSQQALAERLLVTKGNVSGLLDRLETLGLVERRACREDRRTHELFLTAQGAQAFDRAAPDLEAFIDQQFAGLNAAERATLMSLMAKWDRAVRTKVMP
jgi:DNA-binding MarR family transcriptional regulator